MKIIEELLADLKPSPSPPPPPLPNTHTPLSMISGSAAQITLSPSTIMGEGCGRGFNPHWVCLTN